MSKLSFEEWQAKFDAANKKIMVDWDCGHAYEYVVGAPPPDECDDEGYAQDYENEYLMDNGGEMYCEPSVAPYDDIGFRGCCSGCYDESEDKADYIRGYINQRNDNDQPLSPAALTVLNNEIQKLTITKIVKS